MGHWFIRWFVLTYALHLIGQIAFAQALLWLFGFEALPWLGSHRPLVAFVLVIHFSVYLLTLLTSTDSQKLDRLMRERLTDD